MKKLIILLIVLVLAFSLAACGGKDTKANLDLAAIGKEITDANLFADTALQPVKSEDIPVMVGLDTSACVSATYYTGLAITAEEWGLFECNSAKDAEALVTALKAHRDEMRDTYSSYAPAALPRLDNAVITSKGQYVVYIAADKYAEAKTITDKYFA